MLEVSAYNFEGACFDLEQPSDRQIVGFILSQALYGEATGVYCGKSLYSAHSLEAARFYLKQARQELGHLEIFAEIFRTLELQPQKPHWIIRLLASHNNYYPLKVLMEHAIGEGMVLDIFKDVLLQTLPDADPRVPQIKRKLRVVCREEQEHVAWGEKETRRMLRAMPWLKTPYYGLVELQLLAIDALAHLLRRRSKTHPVLAHLPRFAAHIRARVRTQSHNLGIVPQKAPPFLKRMGAMLAGLLLYARSRFSPSRSILEKTYLRELGFEN
ncbi:MAG: ferritin-like domain-containing protein [Myxococcales bacterium]|nr:ferritin-like domain-containing protein [Myxococcales bacterium]